jgi:hypothetical protein
MKWLAFALLLGCTDQEWIAFKDLHHCKVVAKAGPTGGLTSGLSIFWNDATVTYLCDDGIQYTREAGE